MPNQRGFTIIELLLVVNIIGILSMVSMTEYNKIHNRAYVAAAINDAQLLRRGISMYDAEWGIFPQNPANDVMGLVEQLVDPFGQPYLNPPTGDNFQEFIYLPDAGASQFGDYEMMILCTDHNRTLITISWSEGMETLRLGPG